VYYVGKLTHAASECSHVGIYTGLVPTFTSGIHFEVNLSMWIMWDTLLLGALQPMKFVKTLCTTYVRYTVKLLK